MDFRINIFFFERGGGGTGKSSSQTSTFYTQLSYYEWYVKYNLYFYLQKFYTRFLDVISTWFHHHICFIIVHDVRRCRDSAADRKTLPGIETSPDLGGGSELGHDRAPRLRSKTRRGRDSRHVEPRLWIRRFRDDVCSNVDVGQAHDIGQLLMVGCSW